MYEKHANNNTIKKLQKKKKKKIKIKKYIYIKI